jgi:hypothetical protein
MTLPGLVGGLFVVLSIVAGHATISLAQSGGPYDLRWNTIGGGTTSAPSCIVKIKSSAFLTAWSITRDASWRDYCCVSRFRFPRH